MRTVMNQAIRVVNWLFAVMLKQMTKARSSDIAKTVRMLVNAVIVEMNPNVWQTGRSGQLLEVKQAQI